MTLIQRFLSDRTGATAIEYGLIVALIGLTAVVGFGRAAGAISFMFGDNASRLQQALQ